MSIRIAAIGFSHNHIYGMVNALLKAGAELVWYFDDDPERVAAFAERYPQAQQARGIDEILDDSTIHIIVSAVIPCDRAPLGIRVMQHSKDYVCAKPGFVTLEQLEDARRVQAQTQRIYAVYYGERFGNPATVKAGELVHEGAIGQVVQTVGFGPHKALGHVFRPDWFFDKAYFGGVLNDLASHQIDQFLYFTGSTSAEIVASQIGNFKHTQYPQFEDFGDLSIRSDGATGYFRVDWMTPQGLPTWGDVRLFILGTDGYIEVRKNIDLNGREGTDHLFIVDQQAPRYIHCADMPMPYGAQLIQDVLHRTETAMTQAHSFLASELALIAQKQAKWIDAVQPVR